MKEYVKSILATVLVLAGLTVAIKGSNFAYSALVDRRVSKTRTGMIMNALRETMGTENNTLSLENVVVNYGGGWTGKFYADIEVQFVDYPPSRNSEKDYIRITADVRGSEKEYIYRAEITPLGEIRITNPEAPSHIDLSRSLEKALGIEQVTSW
ncbi:MAG: hypothetical protein ABH849_01030 [Nanoarchaeota archaeon]